MSAVSGRRKMVITDTSFFTIKTSPVNAISAVLFLWSHFELHSSNAELFTQKLDFKMGKLSSLDSVLSPPQQKAQADVRDFLSPKEQSNYSQSEASASSESSLPGWYCENKWRIHPLLSVQWQLKTFLSEHTAFLIEKHSQQSKYMPLISFCRWEMGAQKFYFYFLNKMIHQVLWFLTYFLSSAPQCF